MTSIDALLEDVRLALVEEDFVYAGKLLGLIEEEWQATTGSERRRYFALVDMRKEQLQSWHDAVKAEAELLSV